MSLESIVTDQLKNAIASMIVSGTKTLARHNKRAAELLSKVEGFSKKVSDHNNFLDDIIAIIKPALHLAHEVLEKFIPSYMHIIDWVCELVKEVANELVGEGLKA
jgi:hypothetical protein